MPYNKKTWVNGVDAANETNLNNMENGISHAVDTAENNARDLTLVQLALAKENIVFEPSKVKFISAPGVAWNESIGEIDSTKGYAETVNTSTDNVDITNMNVGDFSSFKVGQEITMQDDGISYNPVDSPILIKSNPQYLGNSVESNLKTDGEGFTLVQIVKEGDFPSISEWSPDGATLSVLSNILTVTGNGSKASVTAFQTTNIIPSQNDNFFKRARVRVTNSDASSLDLRVSDGVTVYTKSIANPTANEWYDISDIDSITSVSPALYQILVVATYADATTANGKETEVDGNAGVSAIDIGQGAGSTYQRLVDKGYSDAEIKQFMLNVVRAGYKEGMFSADVVIDEKSVGKNLLDPSAYSLGTRTGTFPPKYVVFDSNTITLASDGVVNNIATYDELIFRPGETIHYKYGRDNSNIVVRLLRLSNDTLIQTLSNIDTESSVLISEDSYLDILFQSTVDGEEASVTNLTISFSSGLDEFKPYTEDTRTLDYSGALPDGAGSVPSAFDSFGGGVVTERTKEYVLQSSDITALANGTNVQRISISQPTTYASYVGTSDENDFIISGFPYVSELITWDEISNEWRSSANILINSWALMTPLGTYPDLATAKADLAGTKIRYELATPVATKVPQAIIDVPIGATYSQDLNSTVSPITTIQQATVSFNKENLIIESLADPKITFTTNIQNTYVDGANVYRSNVVEDAGKFRFGAFESIGTKSFDPAQSVFNGSSNLGRGGNNQHLRNNSDSVTVLLETGVGIKVIDQDGVEVCRMDSATIATGHSSAYDPTYDVLHVFAHNGTSTVWHWIIDLATVSGDIWSSRLTRTSAQNTINRVSCDLSGTKLEWIAQAKNAFSTTIFNYILEFLTIDTGGLSVTVDIAVEQATDLGTPGQEIVEGEALVDGTTPTLSLNYSFGSGSSVYYARRDGTLSGLGILAPGYTGTKVSETVTLGSRKSNIIEKDAGADLGRLYFAYELVSEVRMSYSDDAGSTWNEINLGTGSNPTIAKKSNGDIIVVYENGGNVVERTLPNDSETPTSLTTLILSASNPQVSPISIDFNKVIVSAETATPSIVIYGEWIGGISLPLTEVDVRLNIDPPQAYDNIIAWTNIDELSGFTVDGLASIVGASDNELYFDLTDVTTDLGAENEVASAGVAVNVGEKVTLKLKLARHSTTDDASINYIVGYVSL